MGPAELHPYWQDGDVHEKMMVITVNLPPSGTVPRENLRPVLCRATVREPEAELCGGGGGEGRVPQG